MSATAAASWRCSSGSTSGRCPCPRGRWRCHTTAQRWTKQRWTKSPPGWRRSRSTQVTWPIGSVARDPSARLVQWLRQRGCERIVLLASCDLPLVVSLPRPDMVGIDRLLDAVAANRLRPADRPAIVVDLGTAITVDLISAEGAFLGGTILPGIGTSARAMHEFTDLLPLVDMQSLSSPPPALGTATVEALLGGLVLGHDRRGARVDRPPRRARARRAAGAAHRRRRE